MNKFRSTHGEKGFTIVEIMITIVIIAILAAIAVPIYAKYVKNARTPEATAKCGEILTACKAWAQMNQSPTTGHPMWPTSTSPDPTGFVDMTATDNFTYATDAAGGDATLTALNITATGKNQMNGVTIKVTVTDINANAGPPTITGL